MRTAFKMSALLLSAVVVGAGGSLGLGLATGGGDAPPANAPVPQFGSPGTGRGESLVLVVTGSYATEAEAQEAAAAMSFADMQGMYVAPADAFSVLSVYEQTNPSFVSASCDTPRPEDVHACETGKFEKIRVQQEPLLRRVEGSRWHAELGNRRAESRACARDDAPPCVTDRFDELLGPDGQLEPGHWLVTSGFRTKKGAEQFLMMTHAVGQEDAVVLRVRKGDDSDVGLGQESRPDGKGPLIDPLPKPESHQ